MNRTRHAIAAALAASAFLTSAACSGGGNDRPTPTPPPTLTPSPTETKKPAPPPKAPPTNPFTGIGRVPKRPTVVVKIDDTAPGRPQVGIDKADIVYIEAVEGGLTRLAAVFASQAPKKVGYVRSTRPSDPDLLLQYGKITEAYSGGAHDSIPRVHRSGITSWSMDDGRGYYRRTPHAGDEGYINVVLNVWKVSRHVKTPRPRKIGWTFAQGLGHSHLHLYKGKHIHTEVTGSYQHGTPVDFNYRPKLHKYVRYINGIPQHAADGKLISATNVIVQSCRVRSHPRDTDIAGNPSQFTYTVGKGKVSVFRHGNRIRGTWSRQRLKDGTTLRAKSGKPIPLAPGNTWVVLIRRGVPVRS
ncbi:MAG TPA: DUF3048 domain-containing protein [Jatrophihabitans sp.]|jgi:hypothetical protein|nr:DUF3048 domain-containing protein [Jatrophihabitans sp.]